MKNLILCRHAKSSWKYITDDIYRPLNKRGISDAPSLANNWQGEDPDWVLCSPAVRAYSSALAYFWENQWPFERLEIKPRLFEADENTLLEEIKKCADTQTRVWMFAHNPGLNFLIDYLTPTLIGNIVTSGRVCLSLNISRWKDISENCATMIDFTSPTQ